MIAIVGSGAFGTALACALGHQQDVLLWGRGLAPNARETLRLPGVSLPDQVRIVPMLHDAAQAEVILLAVPMKALAATVASLPKTNAPLIACCKGIDPNTLLGPSALIENVRPTACVGVLTGPSFAVDIAAGLPTALTLAMSDNQTDPRTVKMVQQHLSGPTLRIYRSVDVVGAELGGALKNVLAIAAGAVIGAGLGQSAQAALLTRGFGELSQIARASGAQAETLMGLSGMGDLMLTAFSSSSRNYRFGLALGEGSGFDENTTVEGVATAGAVAALARQHGLDLPVLEMTQRLISGTETATTAVAALMARPLKEE